MRTGLVIGSATGVWQELRMAGALFQPDVVCAVNDMIYSYREPITAAVSLHPEKMTKWLRTRERRAYLRPEYTVIHKGWEQWLSGISKELDFEPGIVTDQMLPGQRSSGSSGLFAVKVALEDFRCDRVVIVGMPMDEARAHVHKSGKPWRGADRHRIGWEEAHDAIKDRVRSMSGWTAGRFGMPTREWLTQ